MFRDFLGCSWFFGGCSWFSCGCSGFFGVVPGFFGCSWFFGCSGMFRDVPVFRCSVFRCSWKYYMPSYRAYVATGRATKSPGGYSLIWDVQVCAALSAVLVINRVSILADFGHFGHK